MKEETKFLKELIKLCDNSEEELCQALEPYGESEFTEKITETFGEFEEVDSHGGEDQGSDYWAVYKFKKSGYYVKAQGWYASYQGHEWQTISIVEPKKKTITVYE